jgi:hypothetical protein
MTDETRPPPSTLKGRLADVYVPALVSGALDALSRRLGNRATIDDPLYGRASSLASIDPLIGKVSGWFARQGTTYRHVASTTGVDRDVSEGVLAMTNGGAREVPIAVVAERRRLREIELRVYYAAEPSARAARPPLVTGSASFVLPQLVVGLVDALRRGAVESALAAFEESGRVVDARGVHHAKRDGALARFLEGLGALDLAVGGSADDGRTCCVEGAMASDGREQTAAMLALERGDSGLVHEARLYWS